MTVFPLIDLAATGKNIVRLREERGLSVKDLQEYFGFEEPQAIYKWQWGKTLPKVDHLYALSCLFNVPMDDIIISVPRTVQAKQQQADACCCLFYLVYSCKKGNVYV